MNQLTKEDSEDPLSTVAHTRATSATPEFIVPWEPPFDIQLDASQIRIMKCEVAHLSQIVALEHQLFSATSAYDAAFLEEEITAGRYLVALDRNNAIAGYAGLEPENTNIYISNIAVRRSFSGIGLGREFLRNIVAASVKMNAPRITLHVSEHNFRAIKFYSEFGFTVDSFVRDFYCENDSAYYMIYPL